MTGYEPSNCGNLPREANPGEYKELGNVDMNNMKALNYFSVISRIKGTLIVGLLFFCSRKGKIIGKTETAVVFRVSMLTLSK